jgi:hypothetical protein
VRPGVLIFILRGVNCSKKKRSPLLLTEGDEEIILGKVELLYAKMYEPFCGIRLVKKNG